jgi:hypothetical protein
MDASFDRANLPAVTAVFWARPTNEGKARYVVEFGENPGPGDIGALNTIIRQHGGFLGAEVGPMASQATVILNNPDADYSRLNWLKRQLRPTVIGTVVADVYAEARPVVARLRALGDIQFDSQDPARIAELPGVASAQLVGDQVEVIFDQVDPDLQVLYLAFMGQQYFAATTVILPGSPPA